jgi:phospholipase C
MTTMGGGTIMSCRPKRSPPDHHAEEYAFNQLGLRVPAILVSPFVDKAKVINTVFDHTSLLEYLTNKWGLGPLGARTAGANTFADVIESATRDDSPKELPLTAPPDTRQPKAPGRPTLSLHQTALFAMTQLLESMTDVESDALRGAWRA